jgi:hypothetical protein
VSTARREGFTAVKQFGGALAQTLALRVGEFVHQGTMLLHRQRAGRFLFDDFLLGFHKLFILFARVNVKLPHKSKTILQAAAGAPAGFKGRRQKAEAERLKAEG